MPVSLIDTDISADFAGVQEAVCLARPLAGEVEHIALHHMMRA